MTARSIAADRRDDEADVENSGTKGSDRKRLFPDVGNYDLLGFRAVITGDQRPTAGSLSAIIAQAFETALAFGVTGTGGESGAFPLFTANLLLAGVFRL